MLFWNRFWLSSIVCEKTNEEFLSTQTYLFKKLSTPQNILFYPMRKLLTQPLPTGNKWLNANLPAYLNRYLLSNLYFPFLPLSFTTSV